MLHPFVRTGRSLCSHALAGSLLLGACAEDGAAVEPDAPRDTPRGVDASAPTAGDAERSPDAGARPTLNPATARLDAGSRAANDSGTGDGGTTCGDVVAADHPAFEAIKKLATTDEEVRVLVYGQSISEQAWWRDTKRWLEETYPNGKLVMEEHARGGCSSQCLIGHVPWHQDGAQYNRLPADVFAWKPELVIFHVYGDHIDYGYLMMGLQ